MSAFSIAFCLEISRKETVFLTFWKYLKIEGRYFCYMKTSFINSHFLLAIAKYWC